MNTIANCSVYAVIMAGGPAKALWPVVRRKTPVACLDLFHEGSMIARTLRSIAGVVSPERTLVITSREGRECLVASGLEISPENIIAEPAARNTALCIALATAHIKKRDPDAISVVLPLDHHVQDIGAFSRLLQAGIKVAAKKTGLVTIGVVPVCPETDYGYIQSAELLEGADCAEGSSGFSLFRVKTFAEKPDYATAVQFLESRDFYWNSGVFIWHIDAICREFQRSMPELYRDLVAIYGVLGTGAEDAVIEDVYSWVHPISIDYGIMEKADPVYMLAGDFGWTDLVNWDEVVKVASGIESLRDACELDVVREESSGVYLRTPQGKAVCLIGVNDLIVVDTGDALLICGKGESHKVPAAVDQLRRENGEEYL
ncbi:MAG: mannose-1-phosphate guanyltransferase [Chlorobium sp.]|uniref:mannose-1-phosphate guanylyltransferase n=1 Tax=Chlorobium sp. TaxID=1095 RepID=UPI0025C42894|nr:mannose-1-phosphate guanylyltransferase [Chlorobium sp.]MCF8383168.1 mannose-1-phosphate guanyltransferase [Chlorobium sp.]